MEKRLVVARGQGWEVKGRGGGRCGYGRADTRVLHLYYGGRYKNLHMIEFHSIKQTHVHTHIYKCDVKRGKSSKVDKLD